MVTLVKFILWLMSLMPAGMPYWLSSKGAGLWMRLSPVKRETTLRNLERCYPHLDAQERQALALESFKHYLCSILETGHNWYWSQERLAKRCVEARGMEILREAERTGTPYLVLAPHFGAWEYLGFYLQQLPNITILYKPPSHEGLNQALLSKRERVKGSLTPATPTGLRKLYAHLKAGHAAGVLPDQQPSAGKGEFAAFFGNPALTAVLVPRLIQKTGCRILLGACERLPGGKYRVHLLHPDVEIESDDLVKSLTAVNAGVEQVIAIDPPQYLWSYRRFKTQPEGEPPFYA